MAQRAPRPLKLTTLLDQQLWFIGHDIRHADGNALTRFGFDRWRSLSVGTSCYRLPGEDPSRHVVCWGFGLYVGPVDEGADLSATPSTAPVCSPLCRGVFIQRHSVTPRLLSHPLRLPVHQPSDLPALRSPVTPGDWQDVQAGLEALASVWSRYEGWARDALGTTHRSHVLAMVPRHKRRRFSTATDLAELWSTQTAGQSVVSH
ncbi:MAG: hypothetical protein HEQ38_06495 [Gemmatimonas sp.]|uniref:hypothetical protein n=1 Tax=Gemmatimonas sp. TaxID=1962908 RepID=UPI0031BD98A3|nr:hypothetical protein [Gemmatimonas sp.]